MDRNRRCRTRGRWTLNNIFATLSVSWTYVFFFSPSPSPSRSVSHIVLPFHTRHLFIAQHNVITRTVVYYYNLGVADSMGGCGHGNYDVNGAKRARHDITSTGECTRYISRRPDDRFVRTQKRPKIKSSSIFESRFL